MENEIVVAGASDMFMPVMDIRQAKARRGALVEFVQSLMTVDHDYGKVPGTGDKPTLLKPGAEKLVTFFGLAPVFVPERVTENFGDDGSEPLFFYRYRCELYRNGVLVGSGIGSCNSRESKYRYRNSDRKCPNCGAAAITRSKYPPRNNQSAKPGWYCYTKKGGCGAEFADGDPAIERQETGKVPNPDVADQVNTIDKMAQKRALIAATLIAVNASEFFTQDVEDMVQYADVTVVTTNGGAAHTNGTVANATNNQPSAEGARRTENSNGGVGNGTKVLGIVSPVTFKHLHAAGASLYGNEWDAKRHVAVSWVTNNRTSSSKELYEAEAQRLIDIIEEKRRQEVAAVTVAESEELNPFDEPAEVPA